MSPEEILFEWNKIGISTLALAANTGVLIYIVLQKRLSQLQTEQVLIHAENVDMDAVPQLFIEHPEMSRYFHEGATDFPDEKTRNKAMSMSERILNSFAPVIYHNSRFPRMHKAEWFEGNIINLFATSPVLEEFLEAHQDEYKATYERLNQYKERGKAIRRDRLEKLQTLFPLTKMIVEQGDPDRVPLLGGQ